MKNINIDNCPNLFNLLTLNNVIDDTVIENIDSGESINLNELIEAAANELYEKIQKKKKKPHYEAFFFSKKPAVSSVKLLQSKVSHSTLLNS